MQMDSVRNRIIRINLTISIASFSLLLSTLPASPCKIQTLSRQHSDDVTGFFGMNLLTGLETQPGVFQSVIYSCFCMSFMSYVLFYGYYRYWPTRQHQQQLTDMKALKFDSSVLYSLEDRNWLLI